LPGRLLLPLLHLSLDDIFDQQLESRIVLPYSTRHASRTHVIHNIHTISLSLLLTFHSFHLLSRLLIVLKEIRSLMAKGGGGANAGSISATCRRMAACVHVLASEQK
jgi:hypothetical protein